MEIAALCVSEPKLITHEGKEILTGIYKTPVTRPRIARRTNIEGDGQADLRVHGGTDKAVYAFPLEHYDFYRAQLGHAPYDFGRFGENLTTRGMRESKVRIGDRYRAGEAMFEVSQPRAPCFKFAIKMGTTDAVRTMLTSGRTGFYLRVVEEGRIQVGDALEIAATDPDAPSVEEVHGLYFFDKQNVDGMRRAARCAALALGFRDSFARRLQKLGIRMDAAD